MSGIAAPINRVEGGLTLVQDDTGAIRLQTSACRDHEGQLRDRSAVSAIYLTQQIGADSGIAHALAAAWAVEAACGMTPAANGQVLRDLLYCCAMLHAQVRHFYGQVLPDYLPLAALGGYRGSWPQLQRIAGGLRDKSNGAWARQGFAHPFNGAQVDRLAESSLRSLEVLAGLQQMLALLGGKFPVTMSIVPGGCSTPATEELLLALRLKLEPLRPFLEHGVYQDALVVLGQYPHARTWGAAGQSFLCAGTPGR
ncbi:MAG TPA: nickel-dependent hydrogenase large subunit, partial [bacterium]|nr:nickel-dependent hydrogenase large subunit [bacterium]